MDYDDILVELGEFGPWQVSITIIMSIVIFTITITIIITAIITVFIITITSQMMVTAMLWIPAVVDGIMTLVASYTSLQPKAYRCNIPVSWSWHRMMITPIFSGLRRRAELQLLRLSRGSALPKQQVGRAARLLPVLQVTVALVTAMVLVVFVVLVVEFVVVVVMLLVFERLNPGLSS